MRRWGMAIPPNESFESRVVEGEEVSTHTTVGYSKSTRLPLLNNEWIDVRRGAFQHLGEVDTVAYILGAFVL